MKLVLEALPALALVAAAVVGGRALAGSIAASRRRRSDLHAPWRMETRSGGPRRIVVEVCRPGEDSQPIAELDPTDEEFDVKLHEAEARARNVAAALNAGRR
jgi:hypothetical protein